jgi:uracil-DNA glycosylase
MGPLGGLTSIETDVAACTRCLRLVEYCAEVARVKRRAYRDETYWGRPVPSFGDRPARILVVGLAPAAHGANRTGRMFTGDGSDGMGAGDFLARALHTSGHANQPTSQHSADGLRLSGVYLTAICRCAPPANKPLRAEVEACAPFLERELDAMRSLRVIVSLGKLSFDHVLRVLAARGLPTPRPKPRFGHGVEVTWDKGAPVLLASSHPSRQNTQTGRLTDGMLADVFRRARVLVDPNL